MVVHTDKLVLAHTHEAMELNYFKTTHLIQICEDSFDLNQLLATTQEKYFLYTCILYHDVWHSQNGASLNQLGHLDHLLLLSS